MKGEINMELKKKTTPETGAGKENEIEMKEVAFEDLEKVTGAGEWDDVPPVDEHPYDPETRGKA